jgi:hypothetical protein
LKTYRSKDGLVVESQADVAKKVTGQIEQFLVGRYCIFVVLW